MSDAPVTSDGDREVLLNHRISVTDAVRVKRIRSDLPKPTWTEPLSSSARDARQYCLLQMRDRRRSEANAAYWLFTHICKWADKDKDAAIRLNLSSGVLRHMKSLSGRAYDRKVDTGNEPLTPEEKAWLRRIVELVVRRLHLYEEDAPVGEHLTVDQV